ncbi:MAG: cytochrome c-type biogenesis protein CcmH [Armatimonadota bacterium]|nr:cytochrome c-type biogenesis protein CcmH [Armatimonadota bacterium]
MEGVARYIPMKRTWMIAGIVAITFLFGGEIAHALTVGEVAGEFICQCGCGLTLANCAHGECGPRDQMTTAIASMIAAGKTKPEIIAAFVAQYGERVLAAPTKRGFNLVAWVTPFATLIAGAGLLVLLAWSWAVRRRVVQPTAEGVWDLLSPEERKRLEEELRRLQD